MKVEPKTIKKFKMSKWYKPSIKDFVYGVNVVMNDNKSFPVKDDKGPFFYATKSEAINHVKMLNKEYKNYQIKNHQP